MDFEGGADGVDERCLAPVRPVCSISMKSCQYMSVIELDHRCNARGGSERFKVHSVCLLS